MGFSGGCHSKSELISWMSMQLGWTNTGDVKLTPVARGFKRYGRLFKVLPSAPCWELSSNIPWHKQKCRESSKLSAACARNGEDYSGSGASKENCRNDRHLGTGYLPGFRYFDVHESLQARSYRQNSTCVRIHTGHQGRSQDKRYPPKAHSHMSLTDLI